ncbi:hypothetical protein BD560DRAFT_399945, partial [Blakeslea trispora]
MNQVQAMFFLAASWLEVKPETIKNCWRHTRILESKEDEMVEPPTTALPLEKKIFFDVEAIKKRLLECYEFILNHDIPEDDIETSIHRRYRRKTAAARTEVINAREWTSLCGIYHI